MTLLDSMLIAAFRDAWSSANWTWFREALLPPVFELVDATSFHGKWTAATRTLSMERGFAETAPWADVLEVLHHEMAHQYVSEVLRVTDETAHGPAFRRTLDRMGRGLAGPGAAEDPVLGKVRKLLALAGSPNEHEAASAMKAAHRLMTRHNVDLAAARTEAGLGARPIGPARGRHAAWEKLLIALLSRHFFVRVVWVESIDRASSRVTRDGVLRLRSLTVAECVGTHANLEIAAWVHDFLTQTGERLWVEHRLRKGLAGDRERQRFLAGIMVGFRQKLDESVQECREAGLVWVGDARVDALFDRRHPRLRTAGVVKVVGSEAYHQGKVAGREIVLHKPIRETGSGGGQLEG